MDLWYSKSSIASKPLLLKTFAERIPLQSLSPASSEKSFSGPDALLDQLIELS